MCFINDRSMTSILCLGGNTLLMDPQIITHPRYLYMTLFYYYYFDFSSVHSIGGIFASGNLLKTWKAFPRQHQCNHWCEHYQLPCNYKEWDCDKDSNAPLQLKLHNLKAQPEAIQDYDEDLGPPKKRQKAMSIQPMIIPS